MAKDWIFDQKIKARLYLDAPLAKDVQVDGTADQAHYLRAVMRLKIGTQVALFNGADGEWLAQISELTKSRVSFTPHDQMREQANCPDLWLVFSPLKKQRQDFLIEKATELGIGALWPMRSAYTQNTRLNEDRLSAQIQEAAEQCERLDLPDLKPFLGLEQILENWPEGRMLFACVERSDPQSFKEILSACIDGTQPHAILIGPEGGFSDRDLEILSNYPFVRGVSLGKRILRAETAALAAISCYQAICGDWYK